MTTIQHQLLLLAARIRWWGATWIHRKSAQPKENCRLLVVVLVVLVVVVVDVVVVVVMVVVVVVVDTRGRHKQTYLCCHMAVMMCGVPWHVLR